MIAFLPSLGWQEMFLLMVIGLLLYGRNLPEAGRSMGRLMAQVRRGFQEFKDQLDRDGQIRDVKKTLQDTTQELRRVAQVPRAIADPGRAVRDFASEAMSTPFDAPSSEPEPYPTADSQSEPVVDIGQRDAEQPDTAAEPQEPAPEQTRRGHQEPT